MTVARLSTAFTMPGSTSSVEGALSRLRPPWLEMTMASAPRSTAMQASSGRMMPLMMSLPGQMSRNRFTSSQLTESARRAFA